jgi:PPP family 3-phenylpropionic acid transporter
MQLGLFALSFSLPEPEFIAHETNPISLWHILKQTRILALLLASVLMVGAHSVYYSFFSLYMAEQGVSKSIIGLLWAIGVLCEIGIFILMPKLMVRFSLKFLLLLSLLLASVRFATIGLLPNVLWLIFAVQILHAMTFGAFHASSIEIIERAFTGKHQARGQAIYNSMGYGVGGVIGGVAGGVVMQHFGGQATFLMAACLPIIGLMVIALFLTTEDIDLA